MLSLETNYLRLGNGSIRIGHRPKFKNLSYMRDEVGITEIVSLLSAREGASELGSAIKYEKMKWLWLPLYGLHKIVNITNNAKTTSRDLKILVKKVADELNKEEHIYMHCAAGIHRTGMVTLSLLYELGVSSERGIRMLRSLRRETYEGIGEERIEFVKGIYFNG